MAWLEEFLCVLTYSKRTQWAIFLGVIGFVSANLIGDYFVGRFHFDGPFAPLTKHVSEGLGHRYDKAAWAILGGFLFSALKCYRKDRKRLLRM